MIEAAQKIDSILEYLARYERHAELSNRRTEKMHFQECWRSVFSAFYGDFRLPHYQKTHEVAPIAPEADDRRKTKWFQDLYSRPMRKVVSTSKGFDVLSCGHKIESRFDDTPAKHRRCKECKGLPPPEDRPSRAYNACVKADKALGKIPGKLAGIAGLRKKLKPAESKP